MSTLLQSDWCREELQGLGIICAVSFRESQWNIQDSASIKKTWFLLNLLLQEHQEQIMLSHPARLWHVRFFSYKHLSFLSLLGCLIQKSVGAYRLILEGFPKHLADFVASILSCTYTNILLLSCTVITSRLPPSPPPHSNHFQKQKLLGGPYLVLPSLKQLLNKHWINKWENGYKKFIFWGRSW